MAMDDTGQPGKGKEQPASSKSDGGGGAKWADKAHADPLKQFAIPCRALVETLYLM